MTGRVPCAPRSTVPGEGSFYSRDHSVRWNLLLAAAGTHRRPVCRAGAWTLPSLLPCLGTVPTDGTEVINSQCLFFAFSTAHEVSYRVRHVLLF